MSRLEQPSRTAHSVRLRAGARPETWAGVLRRASLGRYTGVVVGLAAVCIFLWVTEPVFMTWSNWQNVFRAEAVVAILAIGMTFVVLTGGIDLSIASITAASGMILGLSLEQGWHWLPAVAACIAVGLGIGSLNGFLIGVVKIPFFVVTLGTLSIYASFALLTTDGETVSLFATENFRSIQTFVNGTLGPFPNLLLFAAGLYALGGFTLRYTSFGRSVFAVGSNPEAARLTGINVTLVLVSVYTISGMLGGVGAVVLAGRLSAAAPVVDPTLMLTVIAAVLIGGTAFTGGDGGLVGTMIGVLFLGVISNGLSLLGVSAFWQGTVSGLILISAVGLGVLRVHGGRLPRLGFVSSRQATRESE